MSSPRQRRSAIADPGSGPGELGTDIHLALSYAPARHRPALHALFAVDRAMADVVRTTSEPMIGAIRLAWWRERLEELGMGPVPAEPRLQAVARDLVPRGISGGDLAEIELGWARLFEPFPWSTTVADTVEARGRHLFAIGTRALGGQASDIGGGVWALVDAARRCSDEPSRVMLVERARRAASDVAGAKIPKGLRSLSILTAMALRDLWSGEPFEREGAPARIGTMLRHRLTGRLPGV